MNKIIKDSKLIFFICILFIYFIFYWADVVKKIQPVRLESEFSNTYLWWDNFHSVGEILPGMTVLQEYITTETCDGIRMRFSTYGHEVKGIVKVKVYEKDGKEYLNTFFNAEDIIDGEFRQFDFDEILYSDNKNKKTIFILIETEGCDSGNAISVICSNNDTYIDSNLYVNNVMVEGDLILGVITVQNTNYIKIVYFILCFVLLIIIIVEFKMIDKIKIEQIVFFTVIMLGILSNLINPHKSISDEDAHFHTAYRWSNVFLMKENTTAVEERMSPFIIREGDKHHSLVEYPVLETYASIRQKFCFFYSEKEQILSSIPGRNVKYGVFPYFISAFVISLCRILHIGLYPMLFLARFFNLLFFSVLLYYSIKIIPFGKGMIASIALLPMSIQQMASFSADGFVIAIAIFIFSIMIYLIYEKEKITKRDIIIVCSAFFVLAPCKIVYTLLIFLILLIPVKKFRKKSEKIFFFVFLTLLSSFSIFINTNMIQQIFSREVITDNNLQYGLSYIFHNPMDAFMIILRTLVNFGGEYVRGALGGSLQWSSININYIWLSIVFICLVGESYLSCINDKFILSSLDKKIFMGIFFLILFAIEVVFLALETPVNSTTVAGVAGRYLVPIFPLLFIGIGGTESCIKKNELNRIKKNLFLVQVLIEELILLYIFITIISR